MSEFTHLVCPHCLTTNRVPADKLGRAPNCGNCKKSIFTLQTIELTAASFQPHIARSGIPVIVDFWAPWCGPCQMMAPVFAKAAAELEPYVRLAKLNTEAEPEIAAQFAIRSIPSVLIFKNGREIARQAGAMDKSGLLGFIRSHT